jgi:threonine dehydratase
MAGCSTVVRALCPDAEIVGVEPAGADDTLQSLAAGERRSVPPPSTIADGLRVRTPGELTFPVLRRDVTRIALVRDDELLDAMAWALTELRLVLEPSGAAALAVALREGRGRCGVVLSGGNVDPLLLSQVVSRCKRA